MLTSVAMVTNQSQSRNKRLNYIPATVKDFLQFKTPNLKKMEKARVSLQEKKYFYSLFFFLQHNNLDLDSIFSV